MHFVFPTPILRYHYWLILTSSNNQKNVKTEVQNNVFKTSIFNILFIDILCEVLFLLFAVNFVFKTILHNWLCFLYLLLANQFTKCHLSYCGTVKLAIQYRVLLIVEGRRVTYNNCSLLHWYLAIDNLFYNVFAKALHEILLGSQMFLKQRHFEYQTFAVGARRMCDNSNCCY